FRSRADEPVDETGPPGDGFLAELCQEWEKTAAGVEDAGIRRVSIRTGVVLSSLGGLLRLQAPLFLAGAGGRLGSGEQALARISLDRRVGKECRSQWSRVGVIDNEGVKRMEELV